MRTFSVGVWKEWRDHRGIAVALVIALPVLAFASAWAFGGDLPKADFGPLALFTLTVAQALYVLAVASESFGGERRRGTLDFVRRLPGGLPRVFGAKLGAYVLGTLLSAAWGAVVAVTACQLFGPERAVGDFVRVFLEPDTLTLALAGALFVLGLWVLLVSNFVPQGGAATVGAALLLGLLATPVFLALKDRPWLMGIPTSGMLIVGLGALGLVAFAALSFAFLRGNRFLGGVWGPAWRGLAVLLVVAGGGYAWGAVELHRALTIDPHDPEFRIEAQSSYLGAGGRFLFLTVHRGSIAWTGRHSGEGVDGGTPLQPWIVDLQDGSRRVAGEFLQAWAPVAWQNQRVPQPLVRRYDPEHEQYAWFDARSGELKKVLPLDVRTPDVLALERSAQPALAWHKDAQGRALWIEDQHVVREGEDVPLAKWFLGKGESSYGPIEGGWLGTTAVWDKDRRNAQPAWWILDASTGVARNVDRGGGRVHNEHVLSTHTALRREWGKAPGGHKPPLLPWTLVDLDHPGEPEPTVKPPDREWLVAALPGDRALVMAGTDKTHLTLSAWNPRTGEYQAIVDADGKPFLGRSAWMSAAAPGGLRIVSVTENGESWPEASTLLMDDSLTHAWRLPWNDLGSEVIAIEGPRSIVVLRHGSQVVRHALVKSVGREHETFGVEVLFPR